MSEHLPLLQLWLGLSTSGGSLLGGLLSIPQVSCHYAVTMLSPSCHVFLSIPQSRHLFISGRLLVQVAMTGAALAMFSLYCVTGYYG